MRKQKIFSSFVSFAAYFFFLLMTVLPHFSYAADSTTTTSATTEKGYNIIDADKVSSATGLGKTTPTETIGSIIGIFLNILGILAVVLIIYAGYTWMTSAGNAEKAKKAKDQLQAAFIGLLIIIASYGIALWVFSALEKSTGFK